MQDATAHTDFSHLRRFYFNPHNHVGCDGKAVRQYLIDLEFQSTHPRGCDSDNK